MINAALPDFIKSTPRCALFLSFSYFSSFFLPINPLLCIIATSLSFIVNIIRFDIFNNVLDNRCRQHWAVVETVTFFIVVYRAAALPYRHNYTNDLCYSFYFILKNH